MSIDRSGQDSGGSGPGSACTVASTGHEGTSQAASFATSAPASSASSMAGTQRFSGRAITATSTVIKAASSAGHCSCPKCPATACS